jgi:hypothetical protein
MVFHAVARRLPVFLLVAAIAAVPTTASASTTSVFLSKDAVRDAKDRKLGGKVAAAIRVAKTATASIKVTVPAATTAGAWKLLVCTDAASRVRESNEKNNCRAVALTVTAAPNSGNTTPTPTTPTPPPVDPRTVDSDGDGVTEANGDCRPGDASSYPGAADKPDAAYIDSNCDGIDGDKNGAIFVSSVGSDFSTGSISQPKLTVQAAVDAAKVAVPKKDVYVSGGVHAVGSGLQLATGVSIYGHYDGTTWARPSVLGTVLEGNPSAVSVEATTGVTIQQVDQRATAGGAHGTSHYGIRLAGSSSVTLEDVHVSAAAGVPGADGHTGDPGTAGNNGSPGAAAICASAFNVGGAGGYGPTGKNGGAGGYGSVSTSYAGSPGIGVGAGAGGTSGGGPAAGANGANGTSGAVATDHPNAFWQTGNGESGMIGSSGAGGGGGAGGTGGMQSFISSYWYASGGGGGGGGAGGAPGSSGEGAEGGGGSFAAYVQGGSTLTVSGTTTFDAAAGGAGGMPGVARAGGTGGSGGAGGAGATCSGFYSSIIASAGQPGGHGGNGGAGGAASGANGGPSVAIALAGSTLVGTPSSTSHDVGGTAGPAGAGAPGGTGAGAAGHPGVSGNVVTL